MIKIIAFDLDGVLIKSKETHYIALNKALEEVGKSYVISPAQHVQDYDGLPTRKKLEKLSVERGLNRDLHEQIWCRKQELTFDVIKETVKPNKYLCSVFAELTRAGYRIYVASNAIRQTVKLYLLRLNLMEYVYDFVSNEDVVHSKPHPEMYINIIHKEKILPSEMMIVEDSHVGLRAAANSGAHVCRVKDPDDVTLEKLEHNLKKFDDIKPNIKWEGSGMQVLIPMAGAGSRFAKAGYTFPKPLIEVHGKTMIQTVVDNLKINAHYIYLVRKEHYDQYNLAHMLKMITPECTIVIVDKLTEGAACTTLLAKEHINNDMPLLIANSDQFVEWDSVEFMYSMSAGNIDGGMLTFESVHPKWSYVKLDDKGYICDLKEKQVISNIATVGIYHWSKGSDYVKYAEQMIKKDIRVNGEFYVAPVYNEAIADGKKFRPYNVDKMWGLGTPEDLNYFLENYNGSI